MSAFGFSENEPIEPLVGRGEGIASATEMMVTASRAMLSAASAISSALGPAQVRERELTAEAIELGFLRALRRDSLLGGGGETAGTFSLLRTPTDRGLTGTGYGRMGASITGSGARAQTYGAIGGAIGYAVGGPVGALVGGMLGGLFGGDDDEDEARQQQEEQRQWMNSPEGFEIESYLFNLRNAYAASVSGGTRPPSAPTIGYGGQVVVNLSPGAVQITGQGEESGERAARAFAGALGRVLRLNSVVVPAAGLGGNV